jgi:hypothetical protein
MLEKVNRNGQAERLSAVMPAGQPSSEKRTYQALTGLGERFTNFGE